MKNEKGISLLLGTGTIVLIFLVIIYFVFLLSVVNNRGMLGWDEAARAMGGVTFIKYLTGKLPFDTVLALIGVNHYYVYQGTLLYGPLHALSTGSAYLLFGFSVVTARLPSAVFGALGVLVTYLIARAAYRDGRIAIFAALFLMGSTVYFDFSTMNFSEVPIVFSLSLGTYLLFKVKKLYTASESEKTEKPLVACILLSLFAGILFGFAGITKPSAAVMALPIGIYLFHNSVAFHNSTDKKQKKGGKKKNEGQRAGSRRNLFIILAIPFLILGLSVISYWSYLKSIGFYQLYINFWMGGRGFHPETEPFSLNVILESWKPILAAFPVPVVLLLSAGLYHTIRKKPNSEEVFLLAWIAAYLFSLIASGAIAPQYPLPAIPALAIFASTAMVKIIDYYNPFAVFRRQNPNWKSGVAAILTVFIVLQVAMVPVYKSISLQSRNEIKGEAYNPLIIRTFLQQHAPSLFWINTLYYNGSTINFYARNGLDVDETDTYRTLEANIVKDIQKNNYQTATVIFLSELSNYFDFWYAVDDKRLSYRFVSLEPGMLSQYVAQDQAPKYLIISKENEKKLIENINTKESKLKYSVYKIHVNNSTLELEDISIDQVLKYT